MPVRYNPWLPRGYEVNCRSILAYQTSARLSNPPPHCRGTSPSTKDNEGNMGGAIHNEGAVTVTQDASFIDNKASVRSNLPRCFPGFL